MRQDMVLFAARDVGYSELHLFLESLAGRDLLDRVLLVCPAHYFAVHAEPKPFHLDDDFSDPDRTADRVAAWAAGNGRTFRGIIGVDEDLQFGLSRALSERLKAPFHPEDSCVRASNKLVQKTAFRRHGVPTSRFALTGDAEGLARVGFPCVVKALTSYASQYMGRCDDPQSFERLLGRLRGAAREATGDPRFSLQKLHVEGVPRAIDPREDFLVEEFVEGEEFSCDFMARRGDAQVIRVARKVQGHDFGFFEGSVLLGRREIDSCGVGLGRLTGICRRISDAFGIDTGICMVDFRLRDGEILVLESSIRPGLSATNHLVFDRYGYTPLALLAMMILGEAPEVVIPESGAAVVYLNSAHRDWDEGTVEILRLRHGSAQVYVYDQSEDAGPVPGNDPSALLKGYVVVGGIDGLDWPAVVARAIGDLDAQPE